MTVGERIKYLRKDVLGMTQQKFGDSLSITKASVSRLESGENNPSDQTVQLICREFKVRRKWLEEGLGEMFEPESSTPLGNLAVEYHLNDDERLLIEKFINMTPTQRHLLIYHIKEIMNFVEVIT